MYVRLKRKSQTMFLHVEPHNNFAQIKTRIADILSMDVTQINLIANDKVSRYRYLFSLKRLGCLELTLYFHLVTFLSLFLRKYYDIQKRELVDFATVSDQEIHNDDVIYMVFAKDVGGGWEEIQADTLAQFGEEQGGATAGTVP